MSPRYGCERNSITDRGSLRAARCPPSASGDAMTDPLRPLSVMMVDERSDRVDVLDQTLMAIGYRVVARFNPGDDVYVVFER